MKIITILLLQVFLLSIIACTNRLDEVNKPFPVEPDTTSPSVNITIPSVDEQDVSTLQAISVTFDEPMDETTIIPENVVFYQLPASGSIVPLAFKADSFGYNSDTQTLYFEPAAEMQFDKIYRIELLANSVTGQGITDIEGNLLNNNNTDRFVWSFTTKQDLPLAIKAVRPRVGAVGVDPGAMVEIIFDPLYLPQSLDWGTGKIVVTTTPDESTVPGSVITDQNLSTRFISSPILPLDEIISASFSLNSTNNSTPPLVYNWEFTVRNGIIKAEDANSLQLGSIWGGFIQSPRNVNYPETTVYQHIIDTNGNITLFSRYGTSRKEASILSSRYTIKTDWETPQKISQNFPDRYILNIRAVTDLDGNITIAWLVYNYAKSLKSLWTTHYDVNDGWNTDSNGTPVAIRLDNDDLNSINEFSLISTKDGHVIISYTQNLRLWSNYFNPTTRQWIRSSGTLSPIKLSSNTARGLETARDEKGNITIVWSEGITTLKSIKAARFSLSTDYSPRVSTLKFSIPTASSQIPIKIDTNLNGDAVVSWTEQLVINNRIQKSLWVVKFIDSVGWEKNTSNQVDVAQVDNGSGLISYPNLILDNNGNVTMIWNQESQIWAIRSTPANGWDKNLQGKIEAQVISAQSSVHLNATLLSDTAGNITVIWNTRTSSNSPPSDLLAQRYDLSTGWNKDSNNILSGINLESDDINSVISVKSIAETDGNIHIIFLTQNPSTRLSDLQYTKYDIELSTWALDTAGNTNGILLENNSIGYAQDQNFIVDKKGNIFVSWLQKDGSLLSLYANRYDAKMKSWWKNASEEIEGKIIESDNTYDILSKSDWGKPAPRPMVDEFGNVTIIWRQYKGFFEDIWVNRFD